MRKSVTTGSAVAGLLVLTLAGVSGPSAQDAPTRPPRNLKLVGDHWTAWDPPAAGPDAYIIQKGDTLWDLAQKWLGDPFLWPQVWDANRYIQDSHWIYPGDPLVVPGKPVVVSEGQPVMEVVPEEDAAGEDTAEETEPVTAEPPTPAKPTLRVLADTSDLYCSGYIDPEHRAPELLVAGSEVIEHKHLADGDVIYLNQGRNQAIQAGSEYAVVRPVGSVIHPTTGQDLGPFVRRLGKVRVMLTQEDTSTAVVEFACEDIRFGDQLLPWRSIPAPRRASLPPFDRYDVTPSAGPAGAIVYLGFEWMNAATGNIIHTDLGLASGVQPGDVLLVYRERENLPRTHIGQAIVLTVETTTSTVKLAESVREVAIGDRVELIR
jgi:hypothetical protein